MCLYSFSAGVESGLKHKWTSFTIPLYDKVFDMYRLTRKANGGIITYNYIIRKASDGRYTTSVI